MKIDYKEMGILIADRRKKLGLKQSEVCEKCEINNKYLSNIERAKSIPSIEVLCKISLALKVTPDYFLLNSLASCDKNTLENYEQLKQKIHLVSSDNLSILDSFINWLIYTQNSKTL